MCFLKNSDSSFVNGEDGGGRCVYAKNYLPCRVLVIIRCDNIYKEHITL